MTFVTQGIALHCNRAASMLGALFFYFTLMISWLDSSVFKHMVFSFLSTFQYGVLNTSLKEQFHNCNPNSTPDRVHGTRNMSVTSNYSALCVHGAKQYGLLSLNKKTEFM